MQFFPYAHDNMHIVFDAYNNGTNWTSSSANGSYEFEKTSAALNFHYGVAAAGSTVTWLQSMQITKTGLITMSNSALGTLTNQTMFNLYGADQTFATGPHQSWYTSASQYPMRMDLNWAMDDTWHIYGAFYDSGGQVKASASSIIPWRNIINGGTFYWQYGTGTITVNTNVPGWSTAMSIDGTTGIVSFPQSLTIPTTTQTLTNIPGSTAFGSLTVTLNKIGNIVNMAITAVSTGAAGSNPYGVTTVNSSFVPASNKVFSIVCTNNGTLTFGSMYVNTNGTMTFFPSALTSAVWVGSCAIPSTAVSYNASI
jgi:hypothetical protein